MNGIVKDPVSLKIFQKYVFLLRTIKKMQKKSKELSSLLSYSIIISLV